jgi:hypothetical protein
MKVQVAFARERVLAFEDSLFGAKDQVLRQGPVACPLPRKHKANLVICHENSGRAVPEQPMVV